LIPVSEKSDASAKIVFEKDTYNGLSNGIVGGISHSNSTKAIGMFFDSGPEEGKNPTIFVEKTCYRIKYYKISKRRVFKYYTVKILIFVNIVYMERRIIQYLP